ncbi:2-hydroxyacid dehydrogenase [Phreatobacter oligotrophus]|uniref:Glyoxylate/hydroxypyruvate reductase A n=1 Tax=Phreatobacter oligotrophus TaxID=1122261 RepID=A0A2T4YZZ5_9HYPH|nr:glyoxylate/hydroxypyruvate reductase A [Phreatobacter oligotrophus]PTM52817.1 glyoxylate/hydroxypyruvate reductase A [Phreatobacter oligotrophus]
MTTLLLGIGSWDPEPWRERFQAVLPGWKVVLPGEIFDRRAVRYGAAWKQPEGTFADLPLLDAIFSLGAGVDHLFKDKRLPEGVPVVRVVDPDLTTRMSEYVVMHCLMALRRVRVYDGFQREKQWIDLRDQPQASDIRVGLLGMGVLGQDSAMKLRTMGFQVAGWSRRPKAVEGVEMHHGADGLDAIVAGSDILVAMMPLTPDTAGILDAKLFARMPKAEAIGGPVLINVGRGGLQNEADILAALDSGQLGAAVLDVFQTEPLPADSPLWTHPKVTVTPHNSAISSPPAIAAYVAQQIRTHMAGGDLVNIVDPAHGY